MLSATLRHMILKKFDKPHITLDINTSQHKACIQLLFVYLCLKPQLVVFFSWISLLDCKREKNHHYIYKTKYFAILIKLYIKFLSNIKVIENVASYKAS